MNKTLLELLKLGENHNFECKLAQGGLPIDLWSTYSSFANTEGGSIILGIKEHKESLEIKPFTSKHIDKLKKEFWSNINNTQSISKNILFNHHVYEIDVDGGKLLRIDVPEAARFDKPIYIGTNPLKGTYRRNYDGDFLCSENEVRSMFADQSDSPYDRNIVEEMDISVFNADTVKAYKLRFDTFNPYHVWRSLPIDEFLTKMTAARINNKGNLSPTTAGLLLFGNVEYILEVFPNYFLDYKEISKEKDIRWYFRLTSDDGDWSGNVLDFYFKIVDRILSDISMPFALKNAQYRLDESNVHEACREAIINSLAHANYYGRQGIVVNKSTDTVEISNPGSLRISKDDLYNGGTSDPRNPTIFNMFNRVKMGERAGSGFDKILRAWREQSWDEPTITTSYNPERVNLRLKFGQVVYIKDVLDLRVKQSSATADYNDLVLRSILSNKRKENILKVLSALNTYNIFTNSDVMKAVNCSRATASRIINDLIDIKLASPSNKLGEYIFI